MIVKVLIISSRVFKDELLIDKINIKMGFLNKSINLLREKGYATYMPVGVK